jgi:hypothetical protein
MEGCWPPTKCTQSVDKPAGPDRTALDTLKPRHYLSQLSVPIFSSTMAAVDDKET